MNQQDIGAYIHTELGIRPQALAAGTATSPAGIDRMPAGSDQGFDSCELHVDTGASSGTPTTLSLAASLEQSADGSSGWTAISGSAITAITAVNSQARAKVNLRGCQRYVRATATAAFTGGTTPTILIGCSIAFGGAQKSPVLSLST